MPDLHLKPTARDVDATRHSFPRINPARRADRFPARAAKSTGELWISRKTNRTSSANPSSGDIPEHGSVMVVGVSHPDPNGLPDFTPIEVGEVWENPVSGERATILELAHADRDGRCVVELTGLAGARAGGEHRHPVSVERFTVPEGELTVKRDGQTIVLGEGETVTAEAGVWHDWWNEGDRDARIRAEITPGARIVHMVETMWGLARLGHTNSKECRIHCSWRSPPVSSATSSSSVHRRSLFSAPSSQDSHRSHAGAATARPTRKSHAPSWRHQRQAPPGADRSSCDIPEHWRRLRFYPWSAA